jgi:ribosome biogenesis GTPase
LETPVLRGILGAYGWDEAREHEWQTRPAPWADARPARVVRQEGVYLRVRTEEGDMRTRIAAKLHHSRADSVELPTVGDWVAVRDTWLMGVLSRRSVLVRRKAGARVEGQALAANVDWVLLVHAADSPLRPGWMERALTIASESGARVGIVLTKWDACRDRDTLLAAVREVARDVPLRTTSIVSGEGMDAFAQSLAAGQTVALFGASGAGKSSLVNALFGDSRARTGEVRAHDLRGQHVTTHRELHRLPGGALLVDGPGVRELGVWAEDDALAGAFSEVAEMAQHCKFADCTHGSEPGCAVQQALADGTLDARRWESFKALRDELRSATNALPYRRRRRG